MPHRLRLPRGATIAALIAALFAFIAASAIASESASAQGPITEIVPDDEAGPDPDPQWVTCAQEGHTCTPWNDGTHLVRYGDYLLPGGVGTGGGNWSYRGIAGSTPCTNAVFGDPFPNRSKHCDYDDSGYTYCATEGGTCQVPPKVGAEFVRYGSPAVVPNFGWYVKRVAGSVPCTNTAFGADPYPGRLKACWIYTG